MRSVANTTLLATSSYINSKMASMALKTLAVISMLMAVFASQASAKKHYLYWTVENATLTRNCHTVTVATVNGISPGPTVIIDEDDTLVITVTNKQIYPVTLHWHGIKQLGTNYADGPASITQCPIQQGGSYIYEFTVTGQSGTFFYHAHINWLRATVHGAFIVKPKVKPPYGAVEAEIPIILGEWFGLDPNAYELGFVNTDTPAQNITTITPTVNGNPGPLYNCSEGTTTQFKVKPNKTYLLRIINAAMNNDYFFRVGGHKVTVVGADGNYLKPFRDDLIAITPGQTTDVLLITSKTPGKYYFGFDVGPVPTGIDVNPPPHISALGLFKYSNALPSKVIVPKFPSNVTLKPMDKYVAKLRNLGTYTLKKTPDQDLIYTVDNAAVPCNRPSELCSSKLMGAIQNITFVTPVGTSILQAYVSGASGVYTADFPDKPPTLNLSARSANPSYFVGSRGTRVKVLNYGEVVQLVFQNVFTRGVLDHPFHLHGHDFYVVGRGYGIYNPAKDPVNFNLVDPPLFNTYGLPNPGWLAIRFHANNPGVWLMHCHFERHTTWGMMMAFITKNGGGLTLQPPIHPLPVC